MKKQSRLVLLLFAVLMPLLWGCGGQKVVYVGENEPEDFSLSFQRPIEFEFDIPEDGKYDWGVELTFFPEQLQGWDAVPVYYIHSDERGNDSEGKFKIPIHERNGEWAGELQENQNDRLLNFVFVDQIDLKKGTHRMKLYGDNTQQGQPILGIVKIAFKVLD